MNAKPIIWCNQIRAHVWDPRSLEIFSNYICLFPYWVVIRIRFSILFNVLIWSKVLIIGFVFMFLWALYRWLTHHRSDLIKSSLYIELFFFRIHPPCESLFEILFFFTLWDFWSKPFLGFALGNLWSLALVRRKRIGKCYLRFLSTCKRHSSCTMSKRVYEGE